MASREVLSAVEDLAAIVTGNTKSPSLSADDDACQLIDQVSRVCLSEKGLQDLGTIMSILTEDDDSFCAILVDALGATFTSAIAEGLCFLKDLLKMVRYEKTLRQHVLLALRRIWDCACSIWKLSSTAKVRAAAAELMSEVADVAAAGDRINDLNVAQVLVSFLDEARRHVGKATMGVTVKQALYSFFGTVAHRAPMFTTDHVDSMFAIFLSEIQKEMKGKDPKFAVIAGSLDGLNGLLCNFSTVPKCVSNMEAIFTTCRKVIHVPDVSRYAIVFSALKLLTAHMDKFVKNLLTQKTAYVEMYEDLKRWATHGSNVEARKLGFPALTEFLKQVSFSIVLNLGHKTNVETSNAAFNFFIGEFNEKIKNADNPREMTVAVRGYGYFIAPCRLLASPDQIATMLHEILQKSEQTFFSASTGAAENARLEHLPVFVDTLATMVRDGGTLLPDSFLYAVQRLCLLMISSFPKLGPAVQHTAGQAIVKTIMVVARACPDAKDFLSTIVYEGLQKSCSGRLPTENASNGGSSPLSDVATFTPKVVTYKDYLPLWNKLCGCEYMKELLRELKASEMELYGTAKLIFHEFISATLRLIEAMNFQLVDTATEEEKVSVDLMPVDKSPVNESDFQMFFQLEQTAIDVIGRASDDFVMDLDLFCLELMKLTEKNPLVSGFYRLLEALFRRQNSRDVLKNSSDTTEDVNGDVKMEDGSVRVENGDVKMEVDDSESFQLENRQQGGLLQRNRAVICHFMRHLIGHLQHFSDEVLISALQLLLSFPSYAVQDSIAATMDAVVLALQTGKSYLPLTEATIQTLSRWCFSGELDRRLLQPYFGTILPEMDKYLRSTTLTVAERSKVIGAGKTRKKKPVMSVVTDEAALTKVRESILTFLGQLGGKYNHLILDADFLSDVKNLAIVWDMAQHLQFSFPFADMMLGNFYLDSFLPRVTELCLHSPDRPTKVAACELLHAITVFLVGTHSEMSVEKRDKSTLMDLIAKLMPKILELACDVEPVTKQIFEPLVIQLIHWFSRNAAKASDEATAILDCVMDGLVSERNPALRSFCARCLREFLEWSGKNHPGDQKTVPVAAASLLERIVNYAGHPSSAKRFGAALAFNHCYKSFRENASIVDVFTIDFIVTFTKSLALCHRDPPGFGSAKVVELALVHLARIVDKYAKSLTKATARRRKPVELTEATLADLVELLLLQACRPENSCRMSSWLLIERFLPSLDSAKSSGYFLDNLQKRLGADWLSKAFLCGGFNPSEEDGHMLKPEDIDVGILTEESVRQLKAPLERLSASIDCYTLAFGKVYLKLDSVKDFPEWELFGSLLDQFVKEILVLFDSSPDTLRSTLLSEAFRTLTCSILVRLTDLISIVFTKYGKDSVAALPAVLSSRQFSEIVIRTVVDPASVGFDLHDKEVKNNLLNQMKNFLKVVATVTATGWSSTIRQAALRILQSCDYDLVELVGDSKREAAESLVSGFAVLHEVGLDKEYLQSKNLTSQQFAKNLLNRVTTRLQAKHANSGSRKEAWLSADASHEKWLFGLALLCDKHIDAVVARCISSPNDRLILYAKLRSVFFRHIFSESLIESADHRQEAFFEFLLGKKISQTADRDTWSSHHLVSKDAIEYLTRNRPERKRYGKRVVQIVLERYGSFIELRPVELKHDTESIRTIISFVRFLLWIDDGALKANSAEIRTLYDFYVSVLSAPASSDHQMAATKNRALAWLSQFLTGSNGALVEKAVQNIYINDFPLTAAELPKTSPRYAFYLETINRILFAVQTCKNISVIEICIKLICRDGGHPLLEHCQNAFELVVMNDHSSDIQKIFDIPWNIFTSSQHPPDIRRTAVEKILLVMLRSASQTARVEFFSRTILEITEMLDAVKERVATLGSVTVQTCCFSLLEVMCATLPKTELTTPTAKVVLAYCENPVKGNELVLFISKTADGVSHENIAPEPGMEEARRLLHCAAYRALVAVVTATQTDLKFYHACLFDQKPEKSRFIWTNLVDTTRSYTFEVEFIQAPEKKLQLAAIHREVSRDSANGTASSLYSGIFTATSYASARLASASLIQTSSFSEDLTRYDYSDGLDRTTAPLSELQRAAAKSESLASFELEMDDLNRHECMATLVGLIRHMIDNKITPLTSDALPNWISAIKTELQTGQLNVKLFLAKLIVNTENTEPGYFVKFAEHLYGPLLDLAVEVNCAEGLNYFVVDLLHLMLNWSVRAPIGPEYKSQAQRVFIFLIKHVKHSNSRVQKNNLTLLKVLTEAWKSQLESPPAEIMTALLTKDRANAKLNIPVINIIAIVLDAGLPLTAAAFAEYSRILSRHMDESSKPLYSVAALTMGLLLARVGDSGLGASKIESTVELVNQVLSKTVDTEKDKFVALLHQLSKSYIGVLPGFMSRILFMLPTLPGNIKGNALDVLLAGAADIVDPFKALKACGVFACLKDSNETVQGLTLELFRKIAPRLNVAEFEELIPLMTDLAGHSSPLLREQYYKFCMWMYEHFENSTDTNELGLLRTVRERLFVGLKDRDKPIKDMLTGFWADEKRMSGSTFQRLMTVFTNFITADLTTAFLPIACHLLLDLCQKSPVFNELLFKTALSDCEFFRQEIATSWKQRSTMAPVTAGTFASGSFTGTYGSAHFTQKAPVFTPTQAPGGPSYTQAAGPAFTYSSQVSQSLLVDLSHGYRYAPGAAGDAGTQSTQDENSLEVSRGQQELNAIKRRFQCDAGDQAVTRSFFAKREMNRKKQQEETLKNERERQSLDVTLTRNYRIGEVPDIQIPYAAIIRPLQVLAEHDMQTSSLLLKSVFAGIVAQARTKSEDVDRELEGIAEKIETVLHSHDVTDAMFLSTLLNILVQDVPKESKLLETVSGSAVTAAALRTNQPNLGIAVLENAIILQSSEPEQKKSRQRKSTRAEHWLGIYQLLQSDGQTDSIVGLQLDTVFCQSDQVLSAIEMEARGDFYNAATVYAGLLENPTDDKSAAHVLLESHMRCLEELGRWDELQLCAVPSAAPDGDSQQCGDMDTLWDDVKWVTSLLPYAVKATLNLALDGNETALQQLQKFVTNAMAIPTRKSHLLRQFGLELALIYVKSQNLSEARHHLNNHAAKNFLDDWAGTTQLNQHSRRKQLPLVQSIAEGRRYLEVRSQIDHIKGLGKQLSEQLFTFLADSEREAYVNDPVGVWYDVVANRCLFAADLGDNPGNHLEENLLECFRVHEKLTVVKTAIKQHNFGICDRILATTDSRSRCPDATFFSGAGALQRIEDRWSCAYAEAAVARSRRYQEPEQAQPNLRKLLQAFKLIQKLQDSSSSAVAVPLRSLSADILLAVADLLHQHRSSVELKPDDQKVLGLSSSAAAVTPLYARVFSGFTEACEKATDAAAYLRTFQYCDQLLGKNILDDYALVTTGTKVLLEAIQLGSVEARDLFCRLLVWLREYTDTVEIFRDGCSKIPAWMFLSWSNQMLALLDKPEGAAVHDILLRIATEYPQAMVYGFKMSRENFVFDENDKTGKRNKACFDKLTEKLENPLIDEFVLHLTRLCEPHIFFEDFTNRVEYLLKNKKKAQLMKEYEEIYKKVFADESGSLGQSWKAFVATFRKNFTGIFGTNGGKIANMSISQYKPAKEKLQSDLKNHGANVPYKAKGRLVDLNPWLAEFSSLKYGSSLEIPGQYDGREKPRPESHVKISSFGDEVRTLISIRKPRKLVIRGDDEKDYPFLVKGGEDLRLDQRIEQIFVLMNRIFDQSADCARRHLHIRTYKVVPMTTQVGIIEWVQGSLPIRDFLDKGQPNLDEALQKARNDRYALMKKAMKISEKKQFTALDRELNTQAFTDIKSTDMRKIFQQVCRPFDAHLLRRQLQRLTVSPDAFVIVRNLFAQTYGVMSIGQYILGIGDRHLSNCMVSTETGLIFPIDFGHAFGSGIQTLPIPELAPMRLTRQFVHLMTPFGVKGLLQQTMVHTLRALRKERQILMATMDVFIQEPSMDWLQQARKQAGDAGSQDELLWYPREKIKIAERKLMGGNPGYITRDEARRGVFEKNKTVLAKLDEICVGDPESVRATYGDQSLSVEAQVECLVDMSTDENILGRFYWGWHPWI